MTLIQTMAFRDQFVMVTSDTRVMQVPYGPKTEGYSINEGIIADFPNDKVLYLTEKVLLATSGPSTGAEFMRHALLQRVQPENDLSECAAHLRQILADAENGLLDEINSTAIDFLRNGSTNCDLVGFYHNGKSGLATFEGGSYKRTFVDAEAPMEKAYLAQIHSPDPEEDRPNFFGYINLPENEQRIENFVELFADLHAYFSFNHKAVSSDCNFHFLRNDNGTIKYYSMSQETANRYAALGLN